MKSTWRKENQRECGQGCLLTRANEAMAVQAFYYANLVEQAEQVANQSSDDAANLSALRRITGEAICPPSSSHDDSADRRQEKDQCMQRLRMLALVSIQKYQSAIIRNNHSKVKLMDDPSRTTRFDSPGTYALLDAQGNVARAYEALTPNFVSAQDIAALGDARIQNFEGLQNLAEQAMLQNVSPETLAAMRAQAGQARTGPSAQEQFAGWLEHSENYTPQEEDFVMVDSSRCRSGVCPSFDTESACSGAGGEWKSGICIDTQKFNQAKRSFQGVRIAGSSFEEDMRRAGQRIRRDFQAVRGNTPVAAQQRADLIRRFSMGSSAGNMQQDRAFQRRSDPRAPVQVDNQALGAYARARGTFLGATEAEISGQRTGPQGRNPAARTGASGSAAASASRPAGMGVGSGGSVAATVPTVGTAPNPSGYTPAEEAQIQRGIDESGARWSGADGNRGEATVTATSNAFNQLYLFRYYY
jgi:hypothetical protein